ncbi:cupin domain-containing protein [Phycisphaerales bacterium AB-hyl4]|uniref:Cupin domain-containing protein n=1 Tax=Natronomicrosphaera hydrolytica TaxID=3242702 RepID=A0ABV4U4G7_9BACT
MAVPPTTTPYRIPDDSTASHIAQPPAPPDPADHMLNLPAGDIAWELFQPDTPEQSPAVKIVHVDPNTGATRLFIRCPRGMHVPPHWHTGNETHTVVQGTFIVEEPDGKRVALGPGSFNYIPARMVHQAWCGDGEDVVLFITTDKPWDLVWISEPEAPSA